MATTNKDLVRKVELLQTLAEGCRKHPAYRARRPATQRCRDCVLVWNARLELNEMTDSNDSQIGL
jgi:hypothetical protein